MNRRHFVAAGAAAAIGRGETARRLSTSTSTEFARAHRTHPAVRAAAVDQRREDRHSECAELTRSLLRQAGCQETEIIPTKGHPECGADSTRAPRRPSSSIGCTTSSRSTPRMGDSAIRARVVERAIWGPKGAFFAAVAPPIKKDPSEPF